MAKINSDTVIYNNKPATSNGRDGSITGSGNIWAMVNGAFSNEKVTLWRRDLGYGGYTGVLQDVSDKFTSVRKTYQEGKIIDAEKLLASEFVKRGYKPLVDNPLPLATFDFSFPVNGFVTNYSRITNMENGEVEVCFKHGNQMAKRSCFASRGGDVFAYSYENSGKANFALNIVMPEQVNKKTQNVVCKFEGGCLYVAVRSKEGLDYGFVARFVVASGTIKESETGLIFEGIDGLTMYVKTFNESSRDTEFKKIKTELVTIKSYDKLLSSHESAHKKMFDSYSLSLMADGARNDIQSLMHGIGEARIDSALLSRLWNLGKYLAIVGVPAHNMSMFNAAQLTYCGNMSDILQDMVLSFFEQYEKYIDDLRKNAARVYGMGGYFVPSVLSPKSALFGNVESMTLHFIASSALASSIFYRYFLVTGDIKTLKSRIFPFMREVCNFYSDYLRLGKDGKYTTFPSYSPQSTPGNTIAGKQLENFAFATNSTIDFLAIECLLDNLIDSAKVCGSDDVAMWQDMKNKIPNLAVTSEGVLREFTNSPFMEKNNNCGTMHAYGLWPIKSLSFGDEIVTYQPAVAVGADARERQIGLRQASFNAVMSRLDVAGAKQDARTLAMCALQTAHAGLNAVSSDATKTIILQLLASCFGESGLCVDADWRGSGFTKNGSGNFDVVGNIALTNAITECIVQSNKNTLRVLPNLFDALNSGKINDVMTDFAAKVSIDWDIKKGKCVLKVLPKVSCKINIEVNKSFSKIKDKTMKMDASINGLKDFELVAGKVVMIEFA